VLAGWHPEIDPARGRRIETLLPAQRPKDWQALRADPFYQAAREATLRLNA
jgi:hypothetical protein